MLVETQIVENQGQHIDVLRQMADMADFSAATYEQTLPTYDWLRPMSMVGPHRVQVSLLHVAT